MDSDALSVWIFFRYPSLKMMKLLGSPIMILDADPLEILLPNTIHESDIDARLIHMVRNFSIIYLWIIIFFNFSVVFLTLKCIILSGKPTTSRKKKKTFYMYQPC